MTAPVLSNYLADLAERAGGEYRAGKGKSVEAAERYLASARLIAEAREACRGTRGAWGEWCARADIPETTARLLVRIAQSDLTADDLAERGIRAAARALAKPKPATVAGFEADPDTPTGGDAPPGGATSPPPPAPAFALDPAPSMLPPSATAAERLRVKRAAWRAAGRCIQCGRAADGNAQCARCTERAAGRRRHRQALARTGEALAPRLQEAAAAGKGVHLSAGEVAELAPASDTDGEA